MEPVIVLAMPMVRKYPERQRYLDAFRDKVAGALGMAQPTLAGWRVVLAPMGGAKVKPFQETQARGLVIVGWERPGTPEDIARAFAHPEHGLASGLETALQSGGMSTDTVLPVPLAAQMVGLLNLELGVREVDVSYYRSAGAPSVRETPVPLEAWSGPPVQEGDPALLTRFTFSWEGARRELVHVSYKLTSDLKHLRPSLPVAELGGLRRGGFDVLYLSADGMVFFSAFPGNTSRKADQEALDSLGAEGVVLLDYPKASYCNTPDFDAPDGFWTMGGRAPLSAWGLSLVQRIPLDQPVFGYSGSTPGDSARVYRKMGPPGPDRPEKPFDFSPFTQAGPVFHLRLTGTRPGEPGVPCPETDALHSDHTRGRDADDPESFDRDVAAE